MTPRPLWPTLLAIMASTFSVLQTQGNVFDSSSFSSNVTFPSYLQADEVYYMCAFEFNLKFQTKAFYNYYQVSNLDIQQLPLDKNGVRIHLDMIFVPTKCHYRSFFMKKLVDCGILNSQSHLASQCSIDIVYGSLGERKAFQMENCITGVELELHDNLELLGLNDYHIDYAAAFRQFQEEHAKVYANTQEEESRFQIFQSNMRKATLMQWMELGSAQYGVTPLSDLTKEEFQKNYLTPTWDLTVRPEKEAKSMLNNNVQTPPPSWDWRTKGAVTEVKNQGSCGSCWAFSTTGNVEGQWFVKKGQLLSLSEQELVDCDTVDEGCNGGLPSNAYKAIVSLGGITVETEYPYTGRGGQCHYSTQELSAYVNDSIAISKDESEMAAWLAANGPISIGINANAMQFYMGGVAHPWSIFCSKHHLDHGVLIVGYDTSSKGQPYWIVKNSWGPTWGSKGYYYVYRGDGTCGLNQMCTSAVID